MLGIDNGEDYNTVAAFVRRNMLSYPILIDSDGKAAHAYHVSALPTSVFVDAQGTIRHKSTGSMTEPQIESILVKELGL